MFRLACLALATVFLAGASMAQVPPPPGAPSGDAPAAAEKPGKKKIENKANKKKDDDAKASAAASSTDDIVPLPGDSVYFKTGRVLKGVTVVKESPAGVEVKVTDGDSMIIPRKQIDHIEYQKPVEPAAATAQEPEISILKGQKVSGDLYTKLTAPLPDDALEVKDTDFVKALDDLGKKLGVTIEIADPVKKKPAKERNWSVKLEKGAKLSNLLEDGLLTSFPNLQLDFPQDKIVISEKDAGAAPAPKGQ